MDYLDYDHTEEGMLEEYDSCEEEDGIPFPEKYYKNKHSRYLIKKQKNKSLSERSLGYPEAAYGVNKDHKYEKNPSDILFYKRVYKDGHGKKYRWLKRASNAAVRRSENIGSGKGGYKKVFDLWWEFI